ncbi:MAG: type IV secretory system conjugative DNA transfer family protein [Lachnospiraceae bacterium]|nr:type IV secretory system conjugative DNA transfer family protein [Lachnospiraceae bacterium]
MGRTSFTVIKEQKTPKEKITGYVVGFLVVLYASIMVGACWEPSIKLGEWLNNFYYFVFEQHHFIILAFTKGTPSVILVFEFAWTLFYLVLITKIQHPFAGKEHGDAKWGEAKEFTRDFGNHETKHEVEVSFGDMAGPPEPIKVNTHNYWMGEGVYLNIDNKLTSNLNIEIIGPPGTGKSFRVVRPMLSQLAGSFLVTDPKGELSQQCGQYMEDNGYGVFIIDCESEAGMLNSHHFNPFNYLETESDILSLCEILFKATKNPDASTGDQFFEDMAQVLLTSIFYLMHYTYPQKDQDWKHFKELLDCDTVKADPKTGAIDTSDPNCLMQRFIRANEKWKEEHNGEELKGFRDVEKIYTNAQETASSIVSSLDSHCKFMKLDCVVDLLSTDDLDFTRTFGHALKSKKSPTGKYILFMVTSESVRHFDWIPSMIYSLFIDKLYALTKNDPTLHQTLPEHLTFLMDEFYNVTLPDSFVGLTSTMRSRGISVVIIIQNLLQLKDKFPKNDQDKNLRSNMSTTIVLGGPDMESCKTLSEEFGKQTIHKQTTGISRGGQGSSSENEDVMEHYLFPADKIYTMSKDGPCAIKVKGADPLWVDKIQFQNSPLCPLLTRKNPYKINKPKIEEVPKYDCTKSPLDQLLGIYMDTNAENFIGQCVNEDVKIAFISDEDLGAISILNENNEQIPGADATTDTFWDNLHDMTLRIVQEEMKNALNFDLYSNEQLITVQMLKNIGFSAGQINALNGLINNNYSFEEITRFFNSEMAASDISDFATKLLKIKLNQQLSTN